MLRSCNKCGVEFEHKKDKGVQCKSCKNLLQREWRKKTGYKGKISSLEKRRVYEAAYKERNPTAFSERRKKAWKKRYEEDPVKNGRYRTRALTAYYIRKGKIEKLPCEICKELKVEAHHIDYNKPLLVMWLCKLHHIEWHKNNKVIDYKPKVNCNKHL